MRGKKTLRNLVGTRRRADHKHSPVKAGDRHFPPGSGETSFGIRIENSRNARRIQEGRTGR